jgi:hypothetical protein
MFKVLFRFYSVSNHTNQKKEEKEIRKKRKIEEKMQADVKRASKTK